MKVLTKEAARKLAIENKKIMDFFTTGYKATMDLSDKKTMNDEKVKFNDYVVNDDFETDPQYFAAYYYHNKMYKVLRNIYVTPECRGTKAGTELVKYFQAGLDQDSADFLQVGVEYTKDTYARLETWYTRLGFVRDAYPVQISPKQSFYSFYWSNKPFKVIQRSGFSAAVLL